MRRVIYGGDAIRFADWLGGRLLEVGCSLAYVEAFREDLLRRVASGEIEVRP